MSIFFLITLLTLLINIILLIFNNFKQFNLKINCLINSVVFYLNIIIFFALLIDRNKKYNLSDSKQENKKKIHYSIVVIIIIIIFYYLTKQYEVFCKPFSDLFGYFFITYDTNKLLNKSNKPYNNLLGILLFIVNPIYGIYKKFFKKKERKDYLDIIDNYDNNWKKLINSIEYNNFKGKDWKSVIFDYVNNKKDNNLENLKVILNKRDNVNEVKYSDLSNLFDRKFIISKTIYVIILSIIIISYYNIIISI